MSQKAGRNILGLALDRKFKFFRSYALAVAALVLMPACAVAVPLQAQIVPFNLQWQQRGGTGSAAGTVNLDLSNIKYGSFFPLPSWFSNLKVTVQGYPSGNGTFSQADFNGLYFSNHGVTFDFSKELVGQGGWGTTNNGSTGDFNLFSSGTGAPNGCIYFSLRVSGGSSCDLDLVSFIRSGIVSTTYASSLNSLTSFNGGTLVLDIPNATYSQNFTLDGSTTNTIDQDGNRSTFNGSFSDANTGTPGNISFSNSGSGGNVILSGTNTYTGTTTVNSGAKLSVNGSIASSSGLTVNCGGIIGGNGQLPSTTINPCGVISPGNSIGSLTVNGSYSQLPGSFFNIEINGPQNDKVTVNGTVTQFAGTARFSGLPWPSIDYKALSANNAFANSNSLTLDASGITSSAVLSLGTHLVQEVDGNPNTFDFSWQPLSIAGTGISGGGAVTAALLAQGQNHNNQLQIAGLFDRSFSALANATNNNADSTGDPIGSTGFTTGQAAAAGFSPDFLFDLNQLLTIPTGTQLTAALNSLTPEPYAAMQSVGLDTLKRQRQQILAQAGHCKERGWILKAETDQKESTSAHPLCVFAVGGNANAQINGSNGLASYNSAIFTSLLGVEYQPSQKWTFGGTFSYGTSNLSNYSLSPASISSNHYSGALYGLYKPAGPWNISGLLGYTHFNYSGQRNIALNTTSNQAASHYNANGLTAALNATYDISIGSVDKTHPIFLKPLIGLAWATHQQDNFTETGAGSLNLSVNQHSSQALISTVGMTLEAPIPLSKTTTVVPRLSVAYQHDFLASDTSNQSVSASLPAVPAAGSFSSIGQNQGPDTLNLNADVELLLAPSTALYANTNYEVFTHGNQINYGGGLRIKF